MITSTARVATDRPARYGKQLTSHMARRCETSWDDQTETGSIVLGQGAARTTLACEPGGLVLSVETDPEQVETFEGVLGRHLVRFGRRDELVASWTRSDASQGSVQRNTEDDQA